MKFRVFIFLTIIITTNLPAQNDPYLQIGRVKYSGGGDWYNDPSAEVNLLKFVEENTNIKTNAEYVSASLDSKEILNYPILLMTGHGNISLKKDEVSNLAEYLENGGFMIVDDDYGLDNSFRREIKKVFPNTDLIELPFEHDIYNCLYKFENGPPKTHEHDNKPPRGFGLFLGGRMVIYYMTESNPSDGWANQDVHNDPEEKRLEALKFGTNIIIYALSN